MPRHYVKNPSDGPWKRTLGLYTGWEIMDSNGHIIVRVIDNTHGKPNAILIESAPDLLSALERLAHPMADDEDLDYAREVIAKANGLAV